MHKNARHNERSKNNIQLPLFNNGIQKAPSKSSRRQWPSYDTIDYLDLTQPTQEEQHKQHIAPESKATRMANLDFASSQAILPKDTARKIARNTKRSNNRRRRSSSEYDDSSLEEFFSPMRPAVTDKTDVDSPTVGTSLDLNNHVDQIMGSSNSQPSNFVQSPFTSLVAKTLEPQGRLSYNAPNLSSFDPENTQIEASYYKSLASDQEGTLTKRKFESLTDATNICNASKRPNINMQSSSDGDANTIHDPVKDLQTYAMNQPESQDEEIDALLLQEFGDIVNFSRI